MKPPKHTIQWLAPHLSDGEVQAIYEAVLRDVIGEDEQIKPWLGIAGGVRNIQRDNQRVALNRLFGKESG